MTPMGKPRKGGDSQRMQVIDGERNEVFETTVGELANSLHTGDLLVLNDAGTMPASIRAWTEAGAEFELRFTGPPEGARWTAIALGEGDWRTDTDLRAAPPELPVGARVGLPAGVWATVVAVDVDAPRLVTLAFGVANTAVLELLLRHGRPIQYAYVREAVLLSQVQTAYAARPWAVEMPSAGRPLTWSTMFALQRRGVAVATLTHAAGISATGDRRLDARLPFAERYDLPAATVAAITRTKDSGGRVIAVGTSVVRALEGNALAHGGSLVAGQAVTDLRIGPAHRPRVVDGVLSGVHEPGTSHHQLLAAWAPEELLAEAEAKARASSLYIHEFGDSTLVLGTRVPARPAARSLDRSLADGRASIGSQAIVSRPTA